MEVEKKYPPQAGNRKTWIGRYVGTYLGIIIIMNYISDLVYSSISGYQFYYLK